MKRRAASLGLIGRGNHRKWGELYRILPFDPEPTAGRDDKRAPGRLPQPHEERLESLRNELFKVVEDDETAFL